MSYHVYIARPGFKDTPIGRDEWVRALAAQSRLMVVEKRNRRGPSAFIALLPEDRSQQLSLTPFGLAHVQNPSRAMVEAMFALAGPLEAGVYSAKLKRYDSPEAWAESTSSQRAQLRRSRADAARTQRRWLFGWLAFLVAALGLGWYLGG